MGSHTTGDTDRLLADLDGHLARRGTDDAT